MNDFAKLENENYHQYIWRMDELVQSGKYKNWKEITPFVNNQVSKHVFYQFKSLFRHKKAHLRQNNCRRYAVYFEI